MSTSGPAVCLTWNDAAGYVHWLSRRAGKRYRLPSAAEWEYLARYEQTEGQRQLDVIGLGGGVAEYVADCWVDKPDLEAEAQGIVPATPGCDRRIVKDGAEDEDQRWKRPAARRAIGVRDTSMRVGIRVVRDSSNVGN
jgi:formylglycine-generating enzyme required for sulfatase activity